MTTCLSVGLSLKIITGVQYMYSSALYVGMTVILHFPRFQTSRNCRQFSQDSGSSLKKRI